MRPRVGWAGALLATLAFVSACGGSSSSNQTAKFKTGFTASTTQLRNTSRAIGGAIQNASSETDAQLAVQFRGLASHWQNQASQLQILKPPARYAADFNTLTAAVSRVETDLNAVVAAAATHSKTAGEQAGASIVTDIVSAKSAAQTLDGKLGVKQ